MDHSMDSNVKERSSQNYILHHATDAAMVRHIIERGADPNAKIGFWEQTPLETTITLQRPAEVIRELLRHGAVADMRCHFGNFTPLNLATIFPKCNIEIVKLLLEHGADVNTLDKCHNTPLIYAIRNFTKRVDLVQILLEAGASINIKNLKGETPLIIAMKNTKCTIELLRELLKYKANVNCKDTNGQTPLHHAIICLKSDRFKIVKELLKHGSDFNVRDLHETAPLKCAFHHYQNPSEIHFTNSLIKYIILNNNVNHREFRYLCKYHSRCIEEVDLMKNHIIEGGISVYDYVMSKTVQTVSDKLVEALKKKTYRAYNGLIVKKIERTALLNILCEHRLYTQVSRKETMQKITLDVDSVLCICSYLKTNELKNLVDAYGLVFKEISGFFSEQLKRPAEEILNVISKPIMKKKKSFLTGQKMYTGHNYKQILKLSTLATI